MFVKLIRVIALITLIIHCGGQFSTGNAQSEDPLTPTAITVDNNQDQSDTSPGDGICRAANGRCTLRAAIEESNAQPGANTINLPAMTFVLSSNRELAIQDNVGDDSVAINGAGAGQTIIDGNSATRIFNFVVFTGNHSLSNMTLRDADNKNTDVKNRNGGCIFNEATLTLTNVVINNCRAAQGGGIYNEYAFGSAVPALYLNNVTITNNHAGINEVGLGGGGLFNGSRLNGNGVTITGNSANLQGGGFYNNSYQSEMVLRNFNISNNTARFGGGINSDLTTYTLVLENGVIQGNTANCCNPVNNTATGGAGIYNNEGSMQLTNVTIANNVVPNTVKGGGYGGGIANMRYMALTNVSLYGNQSTYGAALYNGNYNGWGNQMTLTNVTISSNTGPSGFPDSEAAALFSISGQVLIQNTTITQNRAEVTGGIKNHQNNSVIELTNTILGGNLDDYNAADCRGTIKSHGYNTIHNYQGTGQFPCNISPGNTPARPDQLGVLPALLPLTGSPAYHPLVASSQAVDRGTNNQCPALDIAGNQRPFGQSCDIGSFELVTVTSIGNIKMYLPMTMR